MKVVILAGGFGTRIRDVRDDLPKPLISIGTKPIIHHIMQHFASYGFKDFIICAGYQGEKLKQYFLNLKQANSDFTIDYSKNDLVTFHNEKENEKLDWRITVVDTGINSMTGARVKKIEHLINDDDFFITYGDGVGNIELDKLLHFHKTHKKTMTVTGVRPPGRFGELQHENSTVKGFNEKPQVTAGRISGGFFVANKTLFEYLPDNDGLVLEQEPMQKLVSNGDLMMHKHDGFWHPMDTFRDYKYLNDLFNQRQFPWMRNSGR